MSEEFQRLLDSALRMLARREHAEAELAMKLINTKQASPQDAQAVISYLRERDYVSNRRYAEMLLRSRYAKAYGLHRIQAELKQFEVSDALLNDAIAEVNPDWFEKARQARQQRFGAEVVEDYKARAKQMRYLLARGFSQEQAHHAFEKE